MKTKRPSLFAVLDSVQAGSLGAVDKLVLLYLGWRQGRHSAAWPSLDTIAHDLGMDRRLCRRSIDRLCKTSCIEKTSGHCGRGNANHYSILPDKKGLVAPVSEDSKGGGKPLFEREKRGLGGTEKGAASPLKEEGSTKKSSALHTSSSRTNARKRPPKAKTAKPRTRQPFTPPTVDEVRAYAEGRGVPDFDAARFVGYYGPRGWIKVNGEPVVDWKGTVREWMTRNDARRIERGEPPRDGYSQYGTHLPSPEEAEAVLRATR